MVGRSGCDRSSRFQDRDRFAASAAHSHPTVLSERGPPATPTRNQPEFRLWNRARQIDPLASFPRSGSRDGQAQRPGRRPDAGRRGRPRLLGPEPAARALRARRRRGRLDLRRRAEPPRRFARRYPSVRADDAYDAICSRTRRRRGLHRDARVHAFRPRRAQPRGRQAHVRREAAGPVAGRGRSAHGSRGRSAATHA